MHKAAVVIPVYKEKLNVFEKISLMQVKKILGEKYPIIFVAAEGKNFEYFSDGNKIVYFKEEFFKSTKTYNLLMMSKEFYQAFLEYEYILIYQLDAFVFSDKLEYFCNLGYDNIGAAWPKRWSTKVIFNEQKIKTRVGNGGFCLRNVKACYNVLTNHTDYLEKFNQFPEDVFWSICGMIEGSDFSTAPINVAYSFSAEDNPARVVKKNGGELPFGCHAYYKGHADFYVKTLLKCGYDVGNVQNLMGKGDGGASIWLANAAYTRLNRRINKGQSLMLYLPKNNLASIRVIRSPYTMLILMRLLSENNSISDKIYFYNEDERDILISDLKPEKLPHLIITAGKNLDAPLIESLGQKNISYGTRVMTFHKEYFSHCEKFLHGIGK